MIKFLNPKGYKSIESILKKFPYIEHNKRKLLNFKIFIIMDIDEKELTDDFINKYKNKEMFKSYDYYEYIVPIYNDKNLDEVLIKLGYKVDTNNKTSSYRKIFPGNNGDYNSFIQLKNKIKKSKNSNLIELLDYLNDCVDIN